MSFDNLNPHEKVHIQCWNTCTLGVPQGHPIFLMRARRLEQMIVRLEMFPLLLRLRPKDVQGLIPVEGRTMYASDDSAQRRVIVLDAQLLCNLHKFLDLFRASFRLIVTQYQRYDPAFTQRLAWRQGRRKEYEHTKVQCDSKYS